MPAFRVAFLVIIVIQALGCVPRAPIRAIPFDFYRNQIVVAVQVNGHGPYSMVVDTGANPSAVDLEVAKAAGVEVDMTRAGVASGAGSERPAIYAATMENLHIAHTGFGSVEALAVDLSGLAGRFGRPLHGVLGYSLLSGRTVRIDYPARQLQFAEPAQRSGKLRYVLPFRFVDGDTVPVVDISVNGVAVPVSIDTGSSLTVELFPNAVKRLGLEAVAENAPAGTIMGARGTATSTEGVVNRIEIGPFVFRQQAVTFSAREHLTDNRLGNVGNALLQEFVVTIDYTRRVITLERP